MLITSFLSKTGNEHSTNQSEVPEKNCICNITSKTKNFLTSKNLIFTSREIVTLNIYINDSQNNNF